MLVEGLTAYITADDGVKALLGTRSDTGIYPVVAPAGVRMPYVALQQVSSEMLDETMDGTGALQNARWRFSAYGTTYLAAKALAKALKACLLAMYGPLTGGAVCVRNVQLVMEADDAEPLTHGWIYATHLDFSLAFEEA